MIEALCSTLQHQRVKLLLIPLIELGMPSKVLYTLTIFMANKSCYESVKKVREGVRTTVTHSRLTKL